MCVTLHEFHVHGTSYFSPCTKREHSGSYEEVKKWTDSWIASKDASFFRDGIRQLPERWEKVVASNGQYFEKNRKNLT